MSPITVVHNELDQIADALANGAAEISLKTAEWIAGEAKRSMGKEKSGRAYVRGDKTHVASAPGEAPAIDLGNLVNSIQAEQVDQTNALVYTPVDYAVPLEFGSVKMAGRPFFTPAAFRAVPIAWQLTKKFVESLKGRFPSAS